MLLIKFFFYCTAIYAVILLIVFLRQDNFIFFPTQAKHPSPDDKDIMTIGFSHSEETLNGWLVNRKAAQQSLIIYYGGNAEDIFYSIPDFLNYQNCAVLLVNYRGYGSSSGKPGEKEFFEDALAIFDNVSQEYSPNKIFLMGRSLGSGVATYVASRRKIDGVILVTPYDSIKSMARRQFPFLPTSLLLKHPFMSSDYVENITCHCLVIYGGRDDTIPNKNTENLLRYFKVRAEVVRIEEGGHNNIETFEEYRAAIQEFIHKR